MVAHPGLRKTRVPVRPSGRASAQSIRVPAPPRKPTARQIEKAKAKLDHAANGHEALAKQHLANADQLDAEAHGDTSLEEQAATHRRMAGAHLEAAKAHRERDPAEMLPKFKP
jgi:hypothetical protein